MQKAKRKVLIISYLFPPIGGGGVHRALKMAKYLGRYGWEVHVLTVDEEVYYATRDESLLRLLPDNVTIHRAPQWDILGKVYQKTPLSRQARHSRRDRVSLKGRVLGAAKKVFKFTKDRVLIPDDQILWYRSAVNTAMKIIDRHDIDAIYSTSGPNTNHLVALAMKKHRDLPWIADFRDPWTDNMHRSGISWRENLESKLEAKVIQNADVITTVTQSFLNNFRGKYGDMIRRGVVIHNGYDPADYHLPDIQTPHFPGNNTSKTFKLAYAGIFYAERNPRLLLRAVRELINEEKIDPDKIQLNFAGIFDYPGQSANWQAVETYNLTKQVKIHGQLAHAAALEMMTEADLLLLIADTGIRAGDYIPGKLFEYIAIERPILAFTHTGESANIIRQLQNGIIVDPTSLAEIKSALARLYQNWETTGRALEIPDDLRIQTQKYQRQEQARMLADELTRLVSNK